ncbi:hypothetical protein ScPMuIL_017785 [Solemya velum]
MMATTGSERTVLIAMDGSKHSEFAFNWYVKNIHRPGDHVLLAHCADYKSYMSIYGGTAVVPSDHDLLTSIVKEEEQKILKTVTAIEAILKENSKVDGQVVRLTGHPGEAIVSAATEKKVDFIVTGCRGLGQIRRTLMGSVSDFVIHHATMPVFVCRHTS